MNRTSIAAGIAAISALLLAVPAPALAARPVVEHWTDHQEHIEQVEHGAEWCPDVPFDVLYVEDAGGTFRFVRHGDGLYYGASSLEVRGTWTNVETGESFGFVRRGSDKDLHVTDNGDDTITIDVSNTGVTTYYDDEGTRLFKDAGRATSQVIIDINGTPENPEDDEFIAFIPGELYGLWESDGREFCDDIMEFIG
jgi:hypothetical protein